VPVAGPFVPAGNYRIALVVDGKTVDTKPLRVTDDPDVLLTQVERKRMFDMAMEMHALQPRVNEAGAAHASLTRQVTELTTTLGSRSDVPADVKTSVESLSKELASQAPKLTLPAGGRGGGGGGRGGANESLGAKLGQAKNGLMATMTPGEQTTTAYSSVKADLPKAIRRSQRHHRQGGDAQGGAVEVQPHVDGAGARQVDAAPARKPATVR
jgi:hypothetical protein